ncbi:bifunctional metallophosphatase/5'-nucleotidase [Motilimonas pumila]|uniref:Bifunctional metallophosphatase/5'-nucleotidase n=1 Tax=Motilimonas pumila TaxID=2303987 RepID=A0A418YEH2_9GAMM|nr:5'-nucleotidase C-terminal domain-containing protein [Motilimonas pumila]RJG47547.1 bifunctional metallophosphatase/5'-nucleotidase [Motilimonas pumila]
MFQLSHLSKALRPCVAVSVITLGLMGCGSSGSDDKSASEDISTNYFKLQLLHVADMDGSNARVIDNAPYLARNLNAARLLYPENSLFVSSGDNYIPGSRYDASADERFSNVAGVNEPGVARGDIAMLNAMGLQASAVGNHDMDGGPEEFASIISIDNSYPGAAFPYLSSNLDFSTDENTQGLVEAAGQYAEELGQSLTASTLVTVNGQTIGIVGATTPTQEVITSTGDVAVLPLSDANEALAALIQAQVDALTATGVDKIILLAHMQDIAVEKALAGLLQDVDIIVAGGSNTLMADSQDTLWPGDNAAETYPLLLESASAEPVALVNVDGDYKYLGRLVVEFDNNGLLVTASIDENESGAIASSAEKAAELGGEENSQVTAIASAMSDVIVASESNILGNSAVFLNGIRADVRSQETNLGNLTADANLWYAQLADPNTRIAIKNGGGIRAEIGQKRYPAGSTNPDDIRYFATAEFPAAGKASGDISQFDIQTSLAFNNDLVTMTVSAAELKSLLEHSVAAVAADDVSGYGGGRFPQVAGLSFSFDPQQHAREIDESSGEVVTSGMRIQHLTVLSHRDEPDDEVVINGELQGDVERTFTLVTLGYIGQGGDGYPFPCDGDDCANQTPLSQGLTQDPAYSDFAPTGTEQDALAEYLQAFYPNQDAAYQGADDLIENGHSDTRITRL